MTESESLHLSIGVLGVSGGRLCAENRKTFYEILDLTNYALA